MASLRSDRNHGSRGARSSLCVQQRLIGTRNRREALSSGTVTPARAADARPRPQAGWAGPPSLHAQPFPGGPLAAHARVWRPFQFQAPKAIQPSLNVWNGTRAWAGSEVWLAPLDTIETKGECLLAALEVMESMEKFAATADTLSRKASQVDVGAHGAPQHAHAHQVRPGLTALTLGTLSPSGPPSTQRLLPAKCQPCSARAR